MGFIAALLVVIVILLVVNLNQKPRSIGDGLHEVVQEIKKN